MEYSKKFDDLVFDIKAAKHEDQRTLEIWKAANKKLTDLNGDMQKLIGQATAIK